ncbi:zinc finger protein interacting with ribonucleoprotein K [Culex quinquefasciatus]|uniref:zinc finger protein interacting with ribonucleoprotein K n=1 Tax=Culex quinquefasciatus TaxID=7176 RepID=UPI0018E3D617|nr:zinc finger protein interacting with ribonucleoprotein K [Culex quinquefasciatus]
MNTLYLVYVPHTVEYTPAVQFSTLEYATVEVVSDVRVPPDGAVASPLNLLLDDEPMAGNAVLQQLKVAKRSADLAFGEDALEVTMEREDSWSDRDSFSLSIETTPTSSPHFHLRESSPPLVEPFACLDRVPLKIIQDQDSLLADDDSRTSSIDEGIGLSTTDDSGDDLNNNSHNQNNCREEEDEEGDGAEKDINSALIKSKKKRKTSGNKSYQCEICEEIFGKKKLLREHLDRRHPGQVLSSHRCGICFKSFKLRSNLRQHVRIHTGERPFRCDICGKTFVQGSALTVHKELHKERKEYSCGVCKKDFKSKFAFKKHEKVHSGLRPFICDVCGKSFTQSCNLKAHLQLHSGNHAFKCGTCFKTFRFKSHYEDHLMTHTKEKKYSCGKCGRNFAYKNSYQRHMQHIHRIDGDDDDDNGRSQQHQCGVCGKTFPKLSHLTFHKKASHRKGSSLICEICGLVFQKEATLVRHNETVHGCSSASSSSSSPLPSQRLFKCVICSKSFDEECQLTTHFKLHEADDCPFQCGMCGILNLNQA